MDDTRKTLSKSFSLARKNGDLDFEAQLVASLMIQSNALVSIKTATMLCSISRQEIDRRIHKGTFPAPEKLSSEEKAVRKAFRIGDIQEWLSSPSEYRLS